MNIWLEIKVRYWLWKHRKEMEIAEKALLKVWAQKYRDEYLKLKDES